MPSRKKNPSKSTNYKTINITLADELKILRLIDRGEKKHVVAKKFGVNRWDISAIWKARRNVPINSQELGRAGTFRKTFRLYFIHKIEETLSMWIKNLINKKIPVPPFSKIKKKALELHKQLNKKYGKNEIFRASHSWFKSFENRYSLQDLTSAEQDSNDQSQAGLSDMENSADDSVSQWTTKDTDAEQCSNVEGQAGPSGLSSEEPCYILFSSSEESNDDDQSSIVSEVMSEQSIEEIDNTSLDNYPINTGPYISISGPSGKQMASSDTVHVSSLPLPPVHYINLYTDENVRRNRVPKPPLPVHDNYTMFGNIFNAEDPIIRPLEAQGIKRLYPQHFDRRRELKKLNHSLLVNFLDLIDILMLCPESSKRAEKVEDLSLLFIHIHHLLNEFRPHQARETLRVMMEMQKRQRVETALRFQKHLEKVQEIVQNALQSLPDPSESDSKFMVNTEAMEVDNDENTDRKTVDPCSPSDRIMCKEIDDMLLSSGVY